MSLSVKARETRDLILSVTLFFMLYLLLQNLVLYTGKAVLMSVAPVIVYVAAAALILFGSLKKSSAMWIALLFALWYGVSRLILGDSGLSASLDHLNMLLLGAGVLLPALTVMTPKYRKMVTLALAAAVTLFFGVSAWIGVLSAWTGVVFQPADIMKFTGIEPVEGRLVIWEAHPNNSGCYMAVALFSCLYCAFKLKRKRYVIPAAILFIGLYIALALTVSRTAMLEAAFVLGLAAALILFEYCFKRRPRALRFAASACAAVVIAVAAYAGFQGAITASNNIFMRRAALPLISTAAAENSPPAAPAPSEPGAVDETRSLARDISTFTGRTAIYKAGIEAIKARPLTLLIGNLDDTMMDLPNQFQSEGYRFNHMHNSFLQTLMLMGLPGLLLALAFTVIIVVRVLKLLFSGRYSLANRLLALVPIVLLIHSLMENFLFANYSLPNMLFFLFCGMVLSLRPMKKAAKQV